jgi:hypothetical protein
MYRSLTFLLLFFSTCALFAQEPYERWYQGIIYGSKGRVYPDGSAITTGQFYPSSTFMVLADQTGAPLQTRLPSIPGRYTALSRSAFTPLGEILLVNNNSGAYPTWPRPAIISKWNTALDTVWAYAFRDTAYHVANPYAGDMLTASEDGYAIGYSFSDSITPYASAGALVFVDTSGSLQWAKEFPSTLTISHLIRANDGGFICTATDVGGHRVYFKTDAQFNVSWCRELTAAFEMRNEQVVQGNDDVIHYFMGIRDTTEVINFGSSTYSKSMAWLSIDPVDGTISNTREIDFRWPTLPAQLMRTSDGNFIAGGIYTNRTLLYGVLRRWEAFLMKVNGNGDVIWSDSLAMGNYRNRVISVDEHESRLLLYTERYDDINPFHQYYVLDTSATPICGLSTANLHALGSLPITDAAYTLPAFTSASPVRTSVTWTIGTTPMGSVHVCPDLPNAIDEVTTSSLVLSPVPVADELRLSILKDFGKGTITITDMAGRTVLATRDRNTIDVSALSPGIYMLVRTTGVERWSARFVKD